MNTLLVEQIIRQLNSRTRLRLKSKSSQWINLIWKQHHEFHSVTYPRTIQNVYNENNLIEGALNSLHWDLQDKYVPHSYIIFSSKSEGIFCWRHEVRNFVLLGKATVNLLKCTLFSLLIIPNTHLCIHSTHCHDQRKLLWKTNLCLFSCRSLPLGIPSKSQRFLSHCHWVTDRQKGRNWEWADAYYKIYLRTYCYC